MKEYLLNLNFFNVWVYKELSKFPVTIEGRYKKVIEAPHQISVENSITIEGTKKYLMQHPPQNEVKISITIERRKNFVIWVHKRIITFQYY